MSARLFPLRIGVDLGGTKIEAIALDADGRERARRRIASPSERYDDLVGAIRSLVLGLEAALGCQGRVGIGMPGAVSPATGLIKNANATVLNGRPFVADLRQALDRDVRVENDANCFALSEASDGAGAGHRLVFGVILGTGVGGGLVLDGKLWAGAQAIAGEWGHNELPSRTESGLPETACYCGRVRCIETYLSGPALAADHARARAVESADPTDAEHALGALTAVTALPAATALTALTAASIARGARTDAPDDVPRLVARARAGDEAAGATLDRHATRLASALATVVNIVDPDVIVLGGGLSNIDELYPRVRERLPAFVFSDQCRTPVVRNRHGDSSGVRGAAWLWPASSP